MNDCYDIANLPDYEKDCWLNSIIMAVLYSQYSRDFLLTRLSEMKDNIYLNIFKNILISYYSNKRNANVYYKTLKPTELLLQIVLPNLSQREYSLSEYEWTESNIIDFYQYLGVNCQDLIYYKNSEDKDRYILNYISKNNSMSNTAPDVVVLFHQNLNSLANDMQNSRQKYPDIRRYILDTKTTNVGTIATYENEVEFMGVTYILSSCITNNSEEDNKYRSLVGIICNNEKKVFNSHYETKTNPCSIIKYDWDVKKNEEFCFNPSECKINLSTNRNLNIKDLCFNFGSGNRILIYIRKDKIIESKIALEKTELFDLTPEPVLTNYIEEVKRIKELSPVKLYCELENVMGKPINIRNIKFDSNRDVIEKILLEAKLSTANTETAQVIEEVVPVSGGVGKQNKKYTKDELLQLIYKQLKKCKKEELHLYLKNLQSTIKKT